ncbi:hypothetical protein D9757_013070 [Collybiopsis confluens]|uniref:PIH1 N-terminal domain-containing protein n=1 Tax=Collybiopsis confluens TaxID=2823264 RepID=A0A8H5G376_9AGAR|nr:hypothetical protein D9757_013070 [Collybiopsis confluens]
MNADEMDESNPDAWFVPVIVSEGRLDTDKGKFSVTESWLSLIDFGIWGLLSSAVVANRWSLLSFPGKPCLVFDCIFNTTSVKSRVLRDPEFKLFIIELSLQRIEEQTQLVLSRQIGTPNIAAKGKLQPRTVSIPPILAPKISEPAEFDESKNHVGPTKKPLIQEIVTQDHPNSLTKTPKGILKSSSKEATQVPAWSWSRIENGLLQIEIRVPALEKSVISLCSLDIEPRRLILTIPNHPLLDLNLSLSDAELVARSGKGSTTTITDLGSSEGKSDNSTVDKLLALKRQRPFDVEGAIAQWIMADNKLLVSV